MRPRERHTGRPLRGGADRNLLRLSLVRRTSCRPLRGGADRNLYPCILLDENATVAPCAGARIETAATRLRRGEPWSPPARGRGSKHEPAICLPVADLSPPARGRGSKRVDPDVMLGAPRRPLRGGADRNIESDDLSPTTSRRRPLRGGADRNSKDAAEMDDSEWSPPARGRGSKRPLGSLARD